MKQLFKKGISTLPVVNEILLFILLVHEAVELVKNWYKQHKSSTNKASDNDSPENDDEKKWRKT